MLSGNVIQLPLISFEPPHCKRCGSSWIVKDGRYKKRQHRHRCRRCGYRFVPTTTLPKHRFPLGVIDYAVECYATGGESLQEIARRIRKWFREKVSRETIRKWVLKAGKLCFPAIQPDFSPVWQVDETQIKVGRQEWWLWEVKCYESRVTIAWHFSRSRGLVDAVKLFRKAYGNAGLRPAEIVTDGLPAYPTAIKKVFGYRFVRHRIIDDVSQNSRVERDWREVKRRLKWFSIFRNRESVEAFFSLWFYYKDCYKVNRVIGCTPAEMAGFKPVGLVDLLRGLPPQLHVS